MIIKGVPEWYSAYFAPADNFFNQAYPVAELPRCAMWRLSGMIADIGNSMTLLSIERKHSA